MEGRKVLSADRVRVDGKLRERLESARELRGGGGPSHDAQRDEAAHFGDGRRHGAAHRVAVEMERRQDSGFLGSEHVASACRKKGIRNNEKKNKNKRNAVRLCRT